ncbi:MAG: DegT/DnrJ/EryC1/StrS family aminotransferase [Bacteroidales bacterium]|nr:DegT/DnrJ/EryC1/StrS family aminotransferase [Bacteroidales bacterium]
MKGIYLMKERVHVTRSSMPSKEEYYSEISSLWETHWLTNMGVKHNQLEKELCNYLKTENLSLIVNGHLALELAFQALELRGEVITTPFTFASTTHAIIRSGLKPILCDINPLNYTVDVSKIEELITERTCAIVAVHVYGNICDVDSIDLIAQKYNLKVIYDAAHAFGNYYNGKSIANFGDATMFSFHATKVFNTIEGGAISFKNPKYREKVEYLKNFGVHGTEDVICVGLNAKMNEFQAAMGICNLRHIDDEISKRKKIAEKYIKNLQHINGLKLSLPPKGVENTFGYFTILFNESEFGASRDKVYENLCNENIYCRKYFYPLISDFTCFREMFDSGNTPIAKHISQNILSMPIYADLELDTVDIICNIIKHTHSNA